MRNTTWAPNTMLSSRKNLRENFKNTFGQKDRQTLFTGPLSYGLDPNKRISQLRGIAVDNKNKIQYNLAYHTLLT